MVQWQWPKDSNIIIVGVRDLSACQRKSYPGRIEVTLNFIFLFYQIQIMHNFMQATGISSDDGSSRRDVLQIPRHPFPILPVRIN